MSRQIANYELCNSCRKIRSVMNNGNPGPSIEEWLDSPGYRGNPFSHIMMNLTALVWLKANGGCSKCISLFEYVNGPEMTMKANEMADLEISERAEKEEAEKEEAEIEKIEQQYEQEIRSNPNNAAAYIKRGYAFFAHSQAGEKQVFLDHAIADFTEAIKLDPKNLDAYFNRAGLYSQKKDHDHAIADYDRAIKIDANNAELYAFRGQAYTQKENFDQALSDFKEAIRLNPKCKNAYTFRGSTYFVRSVYNKENKDYDNAVTDIDKAIADIEEALRLEPNDEVATYLLKNAKNEKKVVDRMYREAEEAAERAKKERIKKIITASVIVAAIGILIGIVVYNSQENTIAIPEGTIIVRDGEFASKRLVSVEIPNTVTFIGNNSFTKNKLANVVIPDSVKSIGSGAFSNNRFTSITLGSNVEIGREAFEYSFRNAYKGNGMSAGTYKRSDKKSNYWTAWHGNFQFINKDNNISIIDYDGNARDLVIPEKISEYPVRIIGKKAFYEKRFTSVIIPDSVSTIEEMAFCGTWNSSRGVPSGTISSVTFGKNVKTIGDRAFENNALSSIIIPNSVTSIGYSAFADNPVTSVRIGANVKLGSYDSNGVLGRNTGFNGAYTNNGSRAGTYTRPSASSITWTRR